MTKTFNPTSKDIIALVEERGSNTIDVEVTVHHSFFNLERFAQNLHISQRTTGLNDIKVESWELTPVTEVTENYLLKAKITVSDEQLTAMKNVFIQHDKLLAGAIEVTNSFSTEQLEEFAANDKNTFAIATNPSFFGVSEDAQLSFISVSIFGENILASEDVLFNLTFGTSPLTNRSYMNVRIPNLANVVQKLKAKRKKLSSLKEQLSVDYPDYQWHQHYITVDDVVAANNSYPVKMLLEIEYADLVEGTKDFGIEHVVEEELVSEFDTRSFDFEIGEIPIAVNPLTNAIIFKVDGVINLRQR